MKKLLKTVLLAIAFILPGVALATAQFPEIIHIGGNEHALNTNPLAAHLEHTGWTPPADAVISSANWRGYIASWEVKNDQLFLIDVTIRLHGTARGDYVKKSIIEDLFPSVSDGVIANWFSGALIVPQGEITHYVHMGYGSSYESYQVLRIESGQVIEHLTLSDDEFDAYRDKKFKAFTSTDEFKESLDELREGASGMTEEQLLDFMRSFYAERYLSL